MDKHEDRPEIALAFVGPVGVDTARFRGSLEQRLKAFGYELQHVKLSGLLPVFVNEGLIDTELKDSGEFSRIATLMDAGDALRNRYVSGLLAHAAVAEVSKRRKRGTGGFRSVMSGVVWLFDSLKNPAEVAVLRSVYRSGFYLVGLFATQSDRKSRLSRMGMSEDEADTLIARDLEGAKHEQQTRKTFELADAWVSSEHDLDRVVDLIFGSPLQTPTRDENGMAFAYTAALRSGDLSRQVGAAIVSEHGDVVATGCNEAPAPGGGQYYQGDAAARDMELGFDANQKRRSEIKDEVVAFAKRAFVDRKKVADLFGSDYEGAETIADIGENPAFSELLREALDRSALSEITEYGRAVHAEMAALLSAARNGISVRGATLFTTTFPCHNCAKHIVAAGINRVVFVEPYPKSRATHLHGDAITLVGDESEDEQTRKLSELTSSVCDHRTKFEPFLGVGPRRYLDLFSLKLGSGREIKRKDETSGEVVPFERESIQPRVLMPPIGYLEREGESTETVKNAFEDKETVDDT